MVIVRLFLFFFSFTFLLQTIILKCIAGTERTLIRLIRENVTMVDSLEMIASCDLEFGLYNKLNDLIMKNCE